MVRSFLILAATWGVCLSATFSASPAAAADKGAWWKSAKSGSSNDSGNGSSSSSANGLTMPNLRGKIETPSQGPGGNTNGGKNNLNAKGLKLGNQKTGPLKLKQPLDLGALQIGAAQNGPAQSGVPMNGPGGNFGNARQPLPAFDQNKISDALKNAKIRPITGFGGLGAIGGGNGAPGNGAGGGNGNAGNGSLPPDWLQDRLNQFGNSGNLADQLRDGVVIDRSRFNPEFIGGGAGNGPQQDNNPPGGDNVPPGGAPNPGPGGNNQADPDPNGGNPNGGNPGGDPGDGAPGNPGDGNPGGNDPGGDPGDGQPNDPHDDDCHHDHPFPWWPPIIIGGGGGFYCPPSGNVTIIGPPVTVLPAPVQPLPATVDLQLLDVRFVDAGDPARNLGPRYRLVFGNAGTVAVGNFQVLAMASRDGTPDPTAPVATAEVIALAAGEVAMADVRLPLAAELPSMGALIVVVDSALQIAETDEQNNVAVLDRAAITAVD